MGGLRPGVAYGDWEIPGLSLVAVARGRTMHVWMKASIFPQRDAVTYQYGCGALLSVVGFGLECMHWRKKIRPSGC